MDPVIDGLNRRLSVLESTRPLLAQDCETDALSCMMNQPAHQASIQIIQPHTFSAPVFKVEGGGPQQQQPVIVKRRSRAWKPRREQSNYRTSQFLGLPVVAPCAPLDAANAAAGSVWARLVEVAQERSSEEMVFGTAEKV